MQLLIWRDPGARTLHVEGPIHGQARCRPPYKLDAFEEAQDPNYPLCSKCCEGWLLEKLPPDVVRGVNLLEADGVRLTFLIPCPLGLVEPCPTTMILKKSPTRPT